ncbi:hypothetical protein Q4489_10430 [Thalassotalea sp. 1_MG-2023]|uniref:hypothetical protein n=1 Tax=Thalassotalea sp. 1_MG-2023 TaxID=3062680 RepID=UPI0026E46870|nr:hypothetical protein [Thalassotalea sp. 1_MG-2023]MDO6427433.1 hypothetical protein [Thalassotalea sp. 1_MG-2023]
MSAEYDWYVVDLGDAITADIPLERCKAILEQGYQSTHNLLPMAAFYRYESAGLHCHIMLYLTASFQDVAQLPQAALCTKPTNQALQYLAGDENYIVT